MKQLFLTISFLLTVSLISSQCPVNAGVDKFICTGGGITIGPLSSTPGYTYSWSPTTGLSNPNIYNPVASPTSTTTYTLTATFVFNGSSCQDQIMVTVNSVTPTTFPSGPVSYYFWYEGSPTLNIGSNLAGQWYKDDVPIAGATGSSYGVILTGSGSSTHTYNVSNGCMSNDIVVTKIGVTSRNQYPVTVPNESICASNVTGGNSITLTQPTPSGSGGSISYSWWKAGANPSNWAVSPIGSGATASLSESGCGVGCQVDIYTLAYRSNFTGTTYMLFGEGINLGCAVLDRDSSVLFPSIQKTTISPNPAKSIVTVRVKNGIQNLAIYTSNGSLVKIINTNNQPVLRLSLSDFTPGIYFMKFIGTGTIETKKLVIPVRN